MRAQAAPVRRAGQDPQLRQVYVNNEDIRHQAGLDTPVPRGHGDDHPVDRRWGGNGRCIAELSHEEIARYSRHLILPEVGMEGRRSSRRRACSSSARRAGRAAGPLLERGRVGRSVSSTSTTWRVEPAPQVLFGTRDVGGRRSPPRPSGSTTSIRTSPSHVSRRADERERARHRQGLRHRRRRYGQLPDALPGQRRVRAAGNRTSTARSSASRARRACSACRRECTAASIPSRRRRPRAVVPEGGVWACCRGSSAPSRRTSGEAHPRGGEPLRAPAPVRRLEDDFAS